MRWWIPLGVAVLLVGPVALGADVARATAELQQTFPDILLYSEGGQLTRVYGTIFGFGDTPEQSADSFVRTRSELFGVPAEDLMPGNSFNGQYTQPVMYLPETGTYKFMLVYYRQYRDGLPVYGGELRLMVRNEPGYPLVWVGSSIRDIGGFRVPAGATRSVAQAEAIDAALARVPSLINFTEPELVIWAGRETEKVAPRVAVYFEADNETNPKADRPEAWLFVADAATGEILYQESMIIFVDVSGNVSGMATTIPKSDVCNPEVATPMPYKTVSIGSTTVYADINGNFTVPNPGSTPVTVTSPMSGLYFTITNAAGSTETLSLNVTPPGPANFMNNAANTDELVRAQTNGYLQANLARNMVVAVNPAYPTIGTQTSFPVTVNRSDLYCPGNAWYSSSGSGSMHFCRASGSYPNTAFSSVVHHEYGHHAVQRGGSGQGQYGEGMSDCFAVLLSDDPVLGYGFTGNCNAGIRTAANTMQYPCTGSDHTCGQLLSGCLWDTRNALIVTHPTTYLTILRQLAVNSILMHSGTSITPQIYSDFLTLDDDDGNLSNGTPRQAQIYAGFSVHNMIPAHMPPSNDSCANAIAVCPGSYAGTLNGATMDGSASCDSTTAPGADVWYKYTPETSGNATFSMCSSSVTWNSVISVHSACPGTTTNQLNCNNDGCSTNGHGTVTRSVTAGTTYLIRVGGYANTNFGNFTLTVTGPACQPTSYTLTTTVVGQGTVRLEPPGGVYPPNTTVELLANPAAGWRFDRWELDLSGSTNPTTILMNANKSVRAVFVQETYTLTTSVTGSGSILLDPPGGSYPSNTTVWLTALPAAGWRFDRWELDLSGSTSPTSILMNGNKSVRAVFVPAVCAGDSNCDGGITWRDIDFFVAAMNDNQSAWAAKFLPGVPSCPFANNDTNGDGTVSWRDVDTFVALMNSSCP